MADTRRHRLLDVVVAALGGGARVSRQVRRALGRRLRAAGGERPANGWSLRLLAASIAAIGTPAGLMANPQGAQVVQGTATLTEKDKILTVTTSNGAVIHWNQFNIAAGETTRFVQPSVSSQVLNRVLSGAPSQILGSLQSNGRVYLINPSGVAFGKGAQVDVGALAVSTLKLSDEDFKAGRMNFGAVGAGGNPLAGAVRNEGTLRTASGGFVYLVAPQVENSGLIHSPEGQVLLAAGHKVSIVNPRTPEVSWEVSAPASNAVNLGEIVARQIVLHAQNVKNAGLLQATTAVVGEDGRIVLKAAKKVEQTPTGRMVAQGTSAAGGVGGGEIEISGAEQVSLQGRIEATGGVAAPLPASVLALSTAATNAQTEVVNPTGTAGAVAAAAVVAPTTFGSPAGASAIGYSAAGAAAGSGSTGTAATGTFTGTATGATTAPAQATAFPAYTGPLNAGVLQVTGTGTAPFPADNTGLPAPDSATVAAQLAASSEGIVPAGLASAAATTAGLAGPRLSGTPAPAAPHPNPDAPLPRPDPRNALAGGAAGTGGRVRLIGRDVRLGEGLLIDVSGPAGGGTVLAGGELLGQRLGAFGTDQPNAQTLWMAPSAQVRANATVQGHGGTVILWADDTARIHGHLSARGGPLGGDGGFIETSGKRFLDVTRAADASAPQGKGGMWLLDPESIRITTGSSMLETVINPSTIEASLNAGTNVQVVTDATGSGSGFIAVDSPITKSGGGTATLTLNAHGDIYINADIKRTAGGNLNLVLVNGPGGLTRFESLTAPVQIDLGSGTLTALGTLNSGSSPGAVSIQAGSIQIGELQNWGGI